MSHNNEVAFPISSKYKSYPPYTQGISALSIEVFPILLEWVSYYFYGSWNYPKTLVFFFIEIDNKPFYDATAPVRAKYGAAYADLIKRIEAVK